MSKTTLNFNHRGNRIFIPKNNEEAEDGILYHFHIFAEFHLLDYETSKGFLNKLSTDKYPDLLEKLNKAEISMDSTAWLAKNERYKLENTYDEWLNDEIKFMKKEIEEGKKENEEEYNYKGKKLEKNNALCEAQILNSRGV